MFVALWVGGYKQGLMWAKWASGSSYAQFHENLSRTPFLATVEAMWWWWLARTLRRIGHLLWQFAFCLQYTEHSDFAF